jgi:hypothetical protein
MLEAELFAPQLPWRASTKTTRWKHSTHCSSGNSDGQKPDCSTNRHTLTFPPGQFPPVNAFWSVTISDERRIPGHEQINRYLINSPMLPQFKKNSDRRSSCIQKDSPGADKGSN